MTEGDSWLDAIQWNADGLVPAIAQDDRSNEILMLAWINRDALARTLETGFATYWSRSRGRLWTKGEESGHRQRVVEVRLDCDGDALLLRVEQIGGIACHTGRRSCFFNALRNQRWQPVEPIVKSPDSIYPKPK